MLPILLMEPDSNSKRRSFSEALLRKKQAPLMSIEDIKKRLINIRKESTENLEKFIKDLTTSVTALPEMSVSIAEDAGQAVEAIQKISDTTKIAINKSSVVTKELMPQLVSSGFQVIESYYDQFDSIENRIGEDEQPPSIEPQVVFDSFSISTHLSLRRKARTQAQGSKNFIGLLGINAISAEKGAIVMLQHMKNISKVFEQAKKVILVAGLDKIVNSREDAIFQTRSMAVFGWQAIPQSLHGKIRMVDGIDNLPFDVPYEETDQKIHLVLLDNGRRQLLKSPNKEILTCVGCRACNKDCPTSPFFTNQFNPREYLYALLTGKASNFEPCLQCKTCQMNCPVNIDLPGMILDAHKKDKGKKSQSYTNSILSNFETVARLGSATSPLSNSLSNLKPLRSIGEKIMNISSERHLPEFQSKTFAKWFRSKKEK